MFMDKITVLRYKMCHLSPFEATMPVPFPGFGQELDKHSEAYMEDQKSTDNRVLRNKTKGAHPDMQDTCKTLKIKRIWQRNR